MPVDRNITELILRLKDEISKNAGQAQGRMEKLSSSFAKFRRVALPVAGIVTGIGAALFAITKKAANFQDEMLKASQATGTTVEQLSALQFAAKQSGVDQEQLIDRLTNLNRRAQEAAQGTKSYREAFDALGISVTDNQGNLRGTEELLLEIADAFAGMEDGTKKSALATQLFSNQGARLIPFLNQGREGIEALKKQAEELGVVIDTRSARAAEQFNDTLGRLATASSGLGIAIANKLIPSLNSLLIIASKFLNIPVPEELELEVKARSLRQEIERLQTTLANPPTLQGQPFLPPGVSQKELGEVQAQLEDIEDRLEVIREARFALSKLPPPTGDDKANREAEDLQKFQLRMLQEVEEIEAEVERREEFKAEIIRKANETRTREAEALTAKIKEEQEKQAMAAERTAERMRDAFGDATDSISGLLRNLPVRVKSTCGPWFGKSFA